MYKYYPNIFAIHSQCEVKTFCFVAVDTEYIKNKIIKLNDNKIPQVLDILEVKKENIYLPSNPHCFHQILSKQQCAFLKGYSTQQCLLALLEK